MKKITVETSQPYNVLIEQGILGQCGQIIADTVKTRYAALITDDIVDRLYADTVIKSLEESGFKIKKFVFANGETSKCSDNLNNIYTFLAENNITRTDCIIALGGGVTGDISGYAAATYLRGIKYIQIPTTLLAQIDSSVGGKTAINLPCGKNLIGAFKQPEVVICDPLTLKTLSDKIVSDGMAEAIKYGMIRDRKLFDIISQHNLQNYFDAVDDIIFRCVSIKSEIVKNDEHDRGERMLLNFGHTLGHSIESFFNYKKYTHGSAVSMGMYLITKRAAELSLCSIESLSLLKNVLNSYELPLNPTADLKDLVPLCCNDKKCESKSINIIICSDIGTSYIKKMPLSEFYSFMDL